MSTKEIFCDRPFRELSIEREKAKICCYMPNVWGWTIPKSPISKTWNNPAIQKIRKSILEGTFDNCQKCPRYLGEVSDAILPHYTPVMTKGPQHMALSNDPTCNLACPSCRGSQLPPGIEYNHYVILGEQLQFIGEYKHSLKSLEITTMGDPFGSKSYRSLLKILDPAELPNLQIRLHTNGLMIKTLWPQMRILHGKSAIAIILQSIDAATKETYEINRHGGKWSKLLESLDFIRQIRQDGHEFPWYITMVVQANNWREIPQFIKMGEEYGADFINLTWLTNWRFTRDEYLERAVHLPGHRDYKEVTKLLQTIDETKNGPGIELKSIRIAQLKSNQLDNWLDQ